MGGVVFVEMLIVGITGQVACGKGEIIGVGQEEYGFEVVTLSDCLKQEAEERGLKIVRRNLQNLGDLLRRERGPGILVEMAIDRADSRKVKRLIIDGVRSVGEVKVIKKNGWMVGVETDFERRLKWYLKRGKDMDSLTKESFEEIYIRENSGKNDEEMNIDRCMRLVDFVIENSGTKEMLFKKGREVYQKVI